MADKKSTPKDTVSTKPSLAEQLTKKRAELLAARQGLGSTLQNPHAISALKKDIARILTRINKGEK